MNTTQILSIVVSIIVSSFIIVFTINENTYKSQTTKRTTNDNQTFSFQQIIDENTK